MKKVLILISLFVATAAFSSDRSIQVKGQWKTKVKDDRGSILLTVYTLDDNYKKAGATTDRIYNTLVKEISRLKLKDLKVESTNYKLNEKYKWKKGTKILLGHEASIGLKVTTSEIKRIGEVIQKARKVGVKNIGKLHTFIAESTRKNIYLKGLSKAANDAKDKADEILSTLGAKRSKAIHVVEGAPTFVPIPTPRSMFAMEKSLKSAPTPAVIQGGESQVVVNVSITFEIK